MDVSERHGLRSAFYFLSHNDGGPDAHACNVLEHPWVRGLVGHVHRRGHEVGLHAGFGTYRDAARTAPELRDAAGGRRASRVCARRRGAAGSTTCSG